MYSSYQHKNIWKIKRPQIFNHITTFTGSRTYRRSYKQKNKKIKKQRCYTVLWFICCSLRKKHLAINLAIHKTVFQRFPMSNTWCNVWRNLSLSQSRCVALSRRSWSKIKIICFLSPSVKLNASINYTPSTPERVFGPQKEQQLKLRPADKDVHINSVGSKLIITLTKLAKTNIDLWTVKTCTRKKISLNFATNEYVS